MRYKMQLSCGIYRMTLTKIKKNFKTFILCPAARGGGEAGAQGTVEGHARPAGGEAAAAGGTETPDQGERAGEGDVLPAALTQPG